MDDGLVWYAAYGSNLSTERFGCYLAGGRPPGGSRTYEPCPSGTAFRATRPLLLDRRLYFAQRSRAWGGGGVAFIAHDPSPRDRTYGRGYLLRVSQLLHVARQENGLGAMGPAIFDPAGDGLEGSAPIELALPPSKYYRVLLPVGELDGVPVVAVTGSAATAEPNRPTPAYRRTIELGLRETWPELSSAAIDVYLTAAIAGG